ncbi:hypothetical protein NTE_00168 [Candidatus Nitrososphaera evergladensis SR1]|uniref:Uncharacterized protein n=1 Tax=Candidatus Nitrososphaera evergladensis SR1 TaxID=1459636 RepID=A0A075MMA4_9ARCH|nr:hypothetical protein NTE_00168 [Candidatus Nitrososphaera evergladensis SR1]
MIFSKPIFMTEEVEKGQNTLVIFFRLRMAIASKQDLLWHSFSFIR